MERGGGSRQIRAYVINDQDIRCVITVNRDG